MNLHSHLRRLPPRSSLAVLAVLAACGPSLAVPSPDADSEATTTASSTTDDDDTALPPATTSPPATSTSDGTSSDESTNDGGTFIEDPTGCGVAPDGTSLHCTWRCDVVLQDCPEGEKCMPWANDGGPVWNATRCSPISDAPAAVGEVCTVEGSAVSGLDDCDGSSMCWGVDPRSDQGVCQSFCDPEADTCAAPQHCVHMSEGVVSVCVSDCNPLDPASCPEGDACRFVNQEEFVCLPEQGGVIEGSGQLCGGLEISCTPEQACISEEFLVGCSETACCSPFCDTTDPSADRTCATIDPALSCIPWWEEGQAPSGLEALGACAVLPPP